MIVLKIIGTILAGIVMIAFDLLMIALPFLFVYAIYRAIKGIITHNAKLKSQYPDRNQDTENRWTSGQ